MMAQAPFNLHDAPPNFKVSPSGEWAVFVEFDGFDGARYVITAHAQAKSAEVTSTIKFNTGENGYPIIDLSHSDQIDPDSVKLGETTAALRPIRSPGRITQYLMLDRQVEPDKVDTIQMTHRMELSEDDAPEPCRSFLHFRMSHAKHYGQKPTDRLFLERYLPTNLEFDQHPITLEVHLPGAPEMVLFTNGDVPEQLPNHIAPPSFTVSFPPWYTCSCPFFFLEESNEIQILDDEWTTSDKRTIPVVVFGRKSQTGRLPKYKEDALKHLADLQRDFGPYPHDKLLLYGSVYAIEYAGAAEVAGGNVLHELVHQYFGRCVLPADGNAGWIDEAIAHWVVSGCNEYKVRPDRPSNMGAVSPYRRGTDKRARTLGPMLIGYLDHLLRHEGKSMLEFLKELVDEKNPHNRRFQTITCERFQEDLERFAGRRFSKEFDTYVYGRI